MHPATFDPVVRQRLPDLRVGLVEAHNITVRAHDAALWTLLIELTDQLRITYAGRSAADRPTIAATRRAYRELGDDPTRYRPANEALLRRVLSHGALPQINTVVDTNTFVSLESGYVVGCYDLAQIVGPITLRRGAAGDRYAPIGKPDVDAEARLVLADRRGIFGSPTADSQRTMVTDATHAVLFAIFACEADDAVLQRALSRTTELLSCFCAAQITGSAVLSVPDGGVLGG